MIVIERERERERDSSGENEHHSLSLIITNAGGYPPMYNPTASYLTSREFFAVREWDSCGA